MPVDPVTIAMSALELAILAAENRKRNLAGQLEPYIQQLEEARKELVAQANAPLPPVIPEPTEEE